MHNVFQETNLSLSESLSIVIITSGTCCCFYYKKEKYLNTLSAKSIKKVVQTISKLRQSAVVYSFITIRPSMVSIKAPRTSAAALLSSVSCCTYFFYPILFTAIKRKVFFSDVYCILSTNTIAKVPVTAIGVLV